VHFIDPRFAGPDEEIVGFGDDLSPSSLVFAYRHGIFPWPMGLPFLPWFCPPQRAVLDFARLHVPSRLARLRRRCGLTFTIDRDFHQVILACRDATRIGQDGTWITEEFVTAYSRLHEAGYAHSVEAWDLAGELVGGLYGVEIDGVFTGESMFHRAPNASKLALLHFVDHLAARGADWIDIETMTPHFAALGATLISRDEFLDRLEATHRRGLRLFGD
jgi:leucyl/phenylalanyl-tRNA--protein transferase